MLVTAWASQERVESHRLSFIEPIHVNFERNERDLEREIGLNERERDSVGEREREERERL